MFEIRPLRIPDDAELVVPLLNQVNTEPISPERLREDWGRDKPDGFRYRALVLDESGRAVGYTVLARDTWDREGTYFLRVIADRGARRQGIGSAALEDAEAMARRQGATTFDSEVRDNQPESLDWATHRGYKVINHLFESTLDLATFDESRFAGAVEGVEAQGIRFTTLADDDLDTKGRALYNLVSRTCPDIPGWDLAFFPPYEEWAKDAFDPKLMNLDCQILAMDGDRVVGTTALNIVKETGAAYTFHTSVDREYRGRGIALALKLVSVQTARRYGAPYMRTNNDSQNAPMLAVNRKMGYVPAPGIWRMRKELV